ncbi:hypothetical protein LguiB_003607 [Lonicera macranthoides]
MAARAHDVAAIALRGRSACLNFADSTWRLPIPASNDVNDIQRAAAEAAERFRPSDQSDMTSGDNVVQETATSLPKNAFYIDDESIFGMRELLADMAEGLMLPPPHCAGDEYVGDDAEISADMSFPLQFNSSDLFSIKSAQSSSSPSDNTSILHTANPESDAVSEYDVVEECATLLLSENGFYTDNEAVFGLEEVLENMAEGLMHATSTSPWRRRWVW